MVGSHALPTAVLSRSCGRNALTTVLCRCIVAPASLLLADSLSCVRAGVRCARSTRCLVSKDVEFLLGPAAIHGSFMGRLNWTASASKCYTGSAKIVGFAILYSDDCQFSLCRDTFAGAQPRLRPR
jgi:hypothetical protein